MGSCAGLHTYAPYEEFHTYGFPFLGLGALFLIPIEGPRKIFVFLDTPLLVTFVIVVHCVLFVLILMCTR